MTKAELRARMRALKSAATKEQMASESEWLMGQLGRHPRFRSARTVLLFHSLPDEPCTHGFIERWCGQKTILLPVVEGDDLVLRRCVPDGAMREGAFGILEPSAGEAFVRLEEIELAVVPGVAFDAEGHRLGRGRGYYDRLFAQSAMQAYRLGLCFSFQLAGCVPAEAHDALMHEVLAPSPCLHLEVEAHSDYQRTKP